MGNDLCRRIIGTSASCLVKDWWPQVSGQTTCAIRFRLTTRVRNPERVLVFITYDLFLAFSDPDVIWCDIGSGEARTPRSEINHLSHSSDSDRQYHHHTHTHIEGSMSSSYRYSRLRTPLWAYIERESIGYFVLFRVKFVRLGPPLLTFQSKHWSLEEVWQWHNCHQTLLCEKCEIAKSMYYGKAMWLFLSIPSILFPFTLSQSLTVISQSYSPTFYNSPLSWHIRS